MKSTRKPPKNCSEPPNATIYKGAFGAYEQQLNNNRGGSETGENEEIGDRFIELWKEVRDLQLKNLEDAWKSEFKIELLPFLDIVKELTKTLKRIKKPYDELERQTARLRIQNS